MAWSSSRPFKSQLLATAFILITEAEEMEEESGHYKRIHRFWMRQHLQAREDFTSMNTLDKLERHLIRTGQVDEFRNTLRMTPAVFYKLLDLLKTDIQFMNTNYRRCIPPITRLSITLRYASHADCVLTLSQSYLVGYSTVLPLIRHTSRAIIRVLQPRVMPVPRTREAWLRISNEFARRWNIPHCVGCLDGKHLRVRCPRGSGSSYFNYKKFYSVVLMGVVDANYRFIFASVGHLGRESDSTIWKNSSFRLDVEDRANPLDIPAPRQIPGMGDYKLPYYFIADDAFALSTRLMKPIARVGAVINTLFDLVFNYRMSRPRNVVENAFGILSTRFRIFRREQDMEPDGVHLLTMACVCLHNFLMEEDGPQYAPPNYIDREDHAHECIAGRWRMEEPLVPLYVPHHGRQHCSANDMRERLSRWFHTPEGEVPWQRARVDIDGYTEVGGYR